MFEPFSARPHACLEADLQTTVAIDVSLTILKFVAENDTGHGLRNRITEWIALMDILI